MVDVDLLSPLTCFSRAIEGNQKGPKLHVSRFSSGGMDLMWTVLAQQNRAGHPICRKVLKIMFWEIPPADWLVL